MLIGVFEFSDLDVIFVILVNFNMVWIGLLAVILEFFIVGFIRIWLLLNMLIILCGIVELIIGILIKFFFVFLIVLWIVLGIFCVLLVLKLMCLFLLLIIIKAVKCKWCLFLIIFVIWLIVIMWFFNFKCFGLI